MPELNKCIICGSETKDLMGYNYHKVSCSNEMCELGSTALTREQWQAITNNSPLQQTIAEQQKVINKALETTKFYQECSGNKATLKFGYSRVIEELSKLNGGEE